ncbi:MAG: TRAP transporter large permease [Burkholderiaceae bacterium]|nr:TRAP transporter large permease [Burkholderiaceae bacterium]
MIDQFSLFAPIALFFVLMFAGLPVAFSLGIGGVVGLLMTFGLGPTLGMLETLPFRTTASYTLTTIATFVFMAELATHSGITKRLFAAADSFVGHMRGGLAIATVYASAAFGAISGSSVAAAATMAGIAAPQMKETGYRSTLAAGVISIAGTLSVLIPPSLILIIYGIITETSIRKLLLAGIIPGVITAIAYVITVMIWLRVDPEAAPQRRPAATWSTRWRESRAAWPFVLVVATVFVGLYAGIVTTTEAGALGAIATLLVWFAGSIIWKSDFNSFDRENLSSSVLQTLKTTGMIVSLLIGAYFFSYFLTATGVTRVVAESIIALDVEPWVILIATVALLLILGMFLSQLEILVLTMPLLFPVIMQLGYDPVWFGIIVVKTVEIGLVSPPVGMNVYVVAGSSRGAVTPADGFRGAAPFIVTEMFIIGLFIAFPKIITFLPNIAS